MTKRLSRSEEELQPATWDSRGSVRTHTGIELGIIGDLIEAAGSVMPAA